jgi:hypothetical protein
VPKTGADLYSITPDGEWIIILDAQTIGAYEGDHRAAENA